MSKNLQNDLILQAAKREQTERRPVWMMRQAGRYLPEYRAVREKADFLTMCKTPELAAEVTIQPVDIVGVDAAIIFSDILTIPEAMGLDLEFVSGRGPVFHNPVRNDKNVDDLRSGILPELEYVGKAIEETVRQLDGRVPVIGFTGAPWTLATYMVEGGSSKHFKVVKKLLYSQPELLKSMLDKLVVETIEYLDMQIQAGADIVQIFDSWGGILTPAAFKEFALEPVTTIVEGIKARHPETPVTVFSKGARTHLPSLAATGADVLSLDWMIDLGDAREEVGDKVALQGNLDPAILLTDPATIETETRKMLDSYGDGPGHIVNLGHGITPNVPVENARTFVDAVKNYK
ncbi:MAG: uroporphyrinogen decarboxylase [Candidatus Marinimicrobia bacterium]|nr:uroporphyrinogen decarboxylase [Candidatus Neomarinimicrobiota bacterium]MCF7827770.1 uroporphyrinogen decarboxylase [Candidatus Neomarinimicrobiota bacterium]MCF7879475.1 uroporphyrinogen decarboxylase [Candidatus Neomarinimicrobiota bacterium]